MTRMIMAVVLLAAASFVGAQTVAFDGGKAGPQAAAPVRVPAFTGAPVGLNQEFHCNALDHFGALNVAVQRRSDSVHVRLYGWSTASAASQLGLAGESAANSIEVDFPKDWCIVSSSNFGVLSCEVKQTWPPQTIEARAFKDGQLVGSGKLGIYYFTIERTHRISAGVNSDYEQEFLELSTSMISDADNQKRAELAMRYSPRECR